MKKIARIRRVGHRIHGDSSTRNQGAGWEFVNAAVDDYMRLAYGEALPNEAGETTVALRRAFAFYGSQGTRVQRVPSDNGARYVSRGSGRFRTFGACNIRIRLYQPCNNGKAERFVQTMLRE